MTWQGILIGLAIGILATLIGDNQYVRFHIERLFRKLIGKPLISATLSGFINYCSNGLFLIYCIELKNKMWLTSQIPRVYLLSRGTFDYDSAAYKPFVYFRSRGTSNDKLNKTMEELLEEYSNNIIPYTPDNPSLSLTISRKMPYRVVALCELVNNDNLKNKDLTKEGQSARVFGPLNSLNIVGELRLPVANPMPKTVPGAWWNINVISEDFGLIDMFHITIPKDLAEQEPLGDSVDVYKMKERPPCLLDLGYETMLTWRLRFSVDECEIICKSGKPIKIEISRPKKKIHGIFSGISRRQRTDIKRGIKIQ